MIWTSAPYPPNSSYSWSPQSTCQLGYPVLCEEKSMFDFSKTWGNRNMGHSADRTWETVLFQSSSSFFRESRNDLVSALQMVAELWGEVIPTLRKPFFIHTGPFHYRPLHRTTSTLVYSSLRLCQTLEPLVLLLKFYWSSLSYFFSIYFKMENQYCVLQKD